jgi:hypothetical protein
MSELLSHLMAKRCLESSILARIRASRNRKSILQALLTEIPSFFRVNERSGLFCPRPVVGG